MHNEKCTIIEHIGTKKESFSTSSISFQYDVVLLMCRHLLPRRDNTPDDSVTHCTNVLVKTSTQRTHVGHFIGCLLLLHCLTNDSSYRKAYLAF